MSSKVKCENLPLNVGNKGFLTLKGVPYMSDCVSVTYEGAQAELGFCSYPLHSIAYKTPTLDELEVVGNIHDNPELLK